MQDIHRKYNSVYEEEYLNKVAFPLGGIGAGMICFEGTGGLSHISLRHHPEVFNEPLIFSTLHIKGEETKTRLLEGPVPKWKIFFPWSQSQGDNSGNGGKSKNYGLPRFSEASFLARFPFATVTLQDMAIPLSVKVTGWSPFIPNDADNSSLPVAAIEYHFINSGSNTIDAVYSFHAQNFMVKESTGSAVKPTSNGLKLWQSGTDDKPWSQGAFSAIINDSDVKVNHAWFRGGWFDPLSMLWKEIEEGQIPERLPISDGEPSPGGSLFVPFTLKPNTEKKISVLFSWFVPYSDLSFGRGVDDELKSDQCSGGTCKTCEQTYEPWYAERFPDIDSLTEYWSQNYQNLRDESEKFQRCFYDMTLPDEVIEAVAANLTILKSPTVLRQSDGRLWCWEGCRDSSGCCGGSCTHVWNYAQALPSLFSDLERGLRQTEFGEFQDEEGHQVFRVPLPIRQSIHGSLSASDGQLGGIIKAYRDWRISGDTGWLKSLWPQIKKSMDYCIEAWDPDYKGVLVEPHHNTYDIEFWGPESMCSSFYLGALSAFINMGQVMNEDITFYKDLLKRGNIFLRVNLFNGEYFYQKTQWEGLRAGDPTKVESVIGNVYSSPEAVELLKKEGPKYQYGKGCLADGLIGAWLAAISGVEDFLDPEKVKSHLLSVFKYNFRENLSNHANPQRPTYALGEESGLLLCSWPKDGKPSLPFVYSNEVWTGIEYQVASHLILTGCVEEGLTIVRACRNRYDGRIRNPFNEYECGHWYARAMSSYALIQALSGVRYDAIDKVLFIEPNVEGDFRSFISTAYGYGTVGVHNGKPFIDWKCGGAEIEKIKYQAYSS